MFKALIISALLICSQAFGALSASDTESLKKAFEEYEQLHQAFFNYDGKRVQAASGKLATTLGEIKNEALSKKLEFSRKRLGGISESSSRSDNNQSLHLVSMAMIHVLNTYKVDGKYKAYQCPMVMKKWIQNTEKQKITQNPYAPEMPNCGGLDE